ncbi:hypothetical protein HHFLNI_HHFLNI_02810, partial [Dysosmobacter welbionis]
RIHGSPSFQTGTRSWKPDRNTSTGRQKCASYPLEASPKKCRSPLQVPCGPLPAPRCPCRIRAPQFHPAQPGPLRRLVSPRYDA